MSKKPNKRSRRWRSAWRMKGSSCWAGREIIALSNIIRHDHTVAHNIQPFTIAEVAIELSTPTCGRVVPGSVIAGADAYAVSVRSFDIYGLSASEMEAESDTILYP